MSKKLLKRVVVCSVAVVFMLSMAVVLQAQPTTKTFGKLPAAKMTPYLLSLIKKGNVYDLGTVRSHDMALWPRHPAFRVLTYKWHSEQDILHPASFYNEQLMCCMHSGSHIDALNHVGEVQSDGTVKLGTETPGVYTTAAKAKEW